MRSPTGLAWTLAAALSALACDTVPKSAVTDCDAQITPAGGATDILIVVDDSGSMLGEQEELSANLGGFMSALLSSPVRLDVRVAVTTTSVTPFSGEAAYLRGPAAAAGTPFPAGAFVAVRRDADGLVVPGDFFWDPALDPATAGWGGPRILTTGERGDAELLRDFEANVVVGAYGTGKEQPLAAMRAALSKAGPGGPNDGFLRPGARLVVLLVTDEDDCSETSGTIDAIDNEACHTMKDARLDPLADYVSFLDAPIHGEERDPLVAVIAGFDASLDPAGCATTGGTQSLDDPTRLDAFLSALDAARPGRTFKDSICGSFGASLVALADRLVPQRISIAQPPADWRMLAVSVERAGARTPCPLALAGTPQATEPGTGAVYAPAPPGGVASLEFQNACRLGLGDRIDLQVVCAR